ncbi:hypothetical protein BDE02_01G393000 [Populus trichocarpa]|nr:hypothetical protein BDE02_01G393000 [Populus trichocarpa]
MASPGNPNQQQGRGISPLPSLFLALNLHITKSHYVHLFLFSGEKCSREPACKARSSDCRVHFKALCF